MKFAGSLAEPGLSDTLDMQPRGGIESLVLEEESSVAIPLHPLGVKPLGNQYTATSNARHATGPFQILPDEMLAIFLEYLDSRDLQLLGSTCKSLFAFCRSDDLWKALFIESPLSKSGSFSWRGSWRATLLGLEQEQVARIKCDSVFSDVLHRPFLCTHTPLTPYTTNIPRGNAIPRMENLSSMEFSENWSDKPFILTAPVREWPVYQSWDTDTLLRQYGDVKFRAEAVDWDLKTYVSYMSNSNDESPLYLFDRGFVEKMGLITGNIKTSPSYWPPECFGEDLFAVLGDQRPDDKWLIVGPARSGSTYHKDPNATSAWNAVLKGSKYWIMFPSFTSSPPPPGVYVSEDQSEVTSPLSIAEWLLGFHAEARKTPGCLEGVCGEGEVLHVPSGWWHLVVNLDASIAITQNFVPRSHLAGVLSFLKDKADQVSGFKKDITDPYGIFVDRMQSEHPDLLRQAEQELEKRAEGRKRKWDAAVGNDGNENSGGFSFGFGDDSDEEIP
ncbi:hypothetical protein BP5796_07459 [Coleophoma crateriformis]|uniref:Uncharacterized protein n=1 Tax=Coleophoma crateriformis TaxID=565419 RepID=A0A3D8RIZ2_9HELO|nr:hypothetical protein BP5796_07459 [Coleophoma crateriformis]